MKLKIRCGQKAYDLEIDAGDLNEAVSDVPRTLGELRHSIAETNNLDPANVKLIRGMTLVGPDDTPLSTFKLKDNDKLLVMGRPMKADSGFRLLCDYEKKNLEDLQKNYDNIGNDLTEMEKNFLTGAQREEMIRKMDKRLKMFTEVGLRHLETIDGLQINTESTAEDQVTRNREKRKSLVKGIQNLLNLNDKYVMRLEEFKKVIEEEQESAK